MRVKVKDWRTVDALCQIWPSILSDAPFLEGRWCPKASNAHSLTGSPGFPVVISRVSYFAHLSYDKWSWVYAEKWKTTRLKAEMMRLKDCRDDKVWQKVTEGDRTMWQRFGEEEKCWRVWGRQKMGVIRQWQTRPQLTYYSHCSPLRKAKPTWILHFVKGKTDCGRPKKNIPFL